MPQKPGGWDWSARRRYTAFALVVIVSRVEAAAFLCVQGYSTLLVVRMIAATAWEAVPGQTSRRP